MTMSARGLVDAYFADVEAYCESRLAAPRGQRLLGLVAEVETMQETHTEEDYEADEQLVEAYKEPPRDCTACFTGGTRPCSCGGRIHNEMHGQLVEKCFSCGTSWLPAR